MFVWGRTHSSVQAERSAAVCGSGSGKDSPALETLFCLGKIIVWEGFVSGHRFRDAEDPNK